jgi:twinkle protein
VSNPKLLNEQNAFDATVRGITPETFAHWHYKRGKMSGGDECHIANHYVEGELVGQKLRLKGKDFKVLGKMDALYGRWLWPRGGKMVVVTEGELDALSVSQAQGNKWPVVSVPNGAQGAEKAIKESIDWLESFERVVFMFDMDEPGRAAAKKCAHLLTPGKAFIATLPLKDANEMLKEGMVKELVSSIWNAAEVRPDGILTLADVKGEALRPVEWGRPWPYEELTKLTYGRRDGETYFLGAGTGVGKTDFLTECITFDLVTLGNNVGVIFLEQDPRETIRRIAGKVGSKRFHVPDGSWTVEDLEAAINTLEGARGKVFMYDNFGSTEWAAVKERITFMATACGCKDIYLDHLTALAAAAEDERKALEDITAEIAMLAKRLKVCIHVVSHLATPEKGSHEEGARVTIRQFKGSRAIGFWAHFMFGLERDQQCEDVSLRHVSTFRVLKDRYTGQSTGKTFLLGYNHETGRLSVHHEDGTDGPTPDNVEEMF